MRYTNFIWDFDGTLFDSYPQSLAAFDEVLTAHAVPHDLVEVNELQVRSFRYVREHYKMTDGMYAEAMRLRHSFGFRPSLAMFPGAAAVLRAIVEAGGKNFLCTHRNETARKYLRLFGVEKYFSGVVDSSYPFAMKPAPDAVEYLCAAYHLEKSETVMIGDREIDVLAGVNAGIDGCLFVSHTVDTEHTAAQTVVRSMDELARALEIPLGEGDILSEASAASLTQEASAAAEALCAAARLTAGDLVVVGCSSSEVSGERIGSSSTPEVAEAVFAGLYEVFSACGIAMAAQCCEHLNRALIVERSVALSRGYEIVNAVPMPKAGGAFGAAAWAHYADPVAVSAIEAEAGLDIGGTLIGMHLRRVAVPLRLTVKQIGAAALSAARTRAPFAGGERTVYDDGAL